MSQIVEFKKNQEMNMKRREFKSKFKTAAILKSKVTVGIDNAKTLAELKASLKKILNGQPGKPGIVDALFSLDR